MTRRDPGQGDQAAHPPPRRALDRRVLRLTKRPSLGVSAAAACWAVPGPSAQVSARPRLLGRGR